MQHSLKTDIKHTGIQVLSTRKYITSVGACGVGACWITSVRAYGVGEVFGYMRGGERYLGEVRGEGRGISKTLQH
jgi:hypothetical protein